jgi:hypothetical protein
MAGPRIYTLDEVNELLPKLELMFTRVDEVRGELRTLHIRANALELIWGAKLHERDCPDHGEFEHYIESMKKLEDEVERLSKKIGKLGGQVKSMDPALIDFYGVREGYLVFWCWTRGEDTIEHWHHVDEGFAGRQRV